MPQFGETLPMAPFSLLAQLIGISVGVYLMLSRSFISGVAMIAIVGVGHFAFRRLSESLMKIHQRNMSPGALEQLELHALSNRKFGSTPQAWEHIANACGAGYIAYVCVASWYLLR